MRCVSVLMAVHNCERWLDKAIDSVLGQSLRDVELVVVDDGSTDGTPAVLRGYADRLSIVSAPWMGLTRALNRGLACCRAPLIARLDADDCMLPERLERQVAYLEARPAVGLLGTAVRMLPEGDVVCSLCGDPSLRAELIRRNPFSHSSVMFRRAVLTAAGGWYDESFQVAQDYELWMRMSRVCELASLPDVLTERRRHPGQVSAVRARERRQAEARVRWGAIRAGWYPWTTTPWAIRASVAAFLTPRNRIDHAMASRNSASDQARVGTVRVLSESGGAR